jgi:hypothetical protein
MSASLPPAALWGWIGALLAFGIGVAHSYLGERYILIRLFRRPDLPPLFGSDWFTRRTLRFAWHLTSVAWWGLGAALLLGASGSSMSTVGAAIAITFAVSALVTAIGSHGRHLAWIVFLAIAAAAWLGIR